MLEDLLHPGYSRISFLINLSLLLDIYLSFLLTLSVRDARPTQTYSFLPASWTGDTHEETDFLPIGDQEEKDMWLLNRRTDNLETEQVLMAKHSQAKVRRDESRLLARKQGLA